MAHPQINALFEFRENRLNTLVVENSHFFRSLVTDLVDQKAGGAGSFILSKADTPIRISKNTELFTQFFPFEPNRKTLISKICVALEKQAVSESFFVQTQELLAELERYLLDLAFELPGDIYFEKLTPEAVVKASGVQLAERSGNTLEQILNYMELVCELEGEKLFIFVNMRSVFSQQELEQFLEDAMGKKFLVFLIDHRADFFLQGEVRCLIDEDLCEI